jgi:hypothetical protein
VISFLVRLWKMWSVYEEADVRDESQTFKFPSWLNDLLQLSRRQNDLLDGSWVFLWAVKFPLWANVLPQTSHLNGLTPECNRSCVWLVVSFCS